MENVDLNRIICDLRNRLNDYLHQTELHIIDNYPFIIQVGALTVTTDDNNYVILHNSLYPTQFSKKAVDEILMMTFKNGNGEIIIPKVYPRVLWYKERMNDIKETITQFEQLHNL